MDHNMKVKNVPNIMLQQANEVFQKYLPQGRKIAEKAKQDFIDSGLKRAEDFKNKKSGTAQ